jgi:methylmalonyl-CoA epimerase
MASQVEIIRGEKWRMNHVGHAVESIESAVKTYQTLYGFELVETEKLEEQKVEAAFLRLDNCEIELIAPLPGNKTLRRFLDKRGEGLHHLCFEVENIHNELKRLDALGVNLIDKEPRIGSRNTLIAFIHPGASKSVLVELCMTQM